MNQVSKLSILDAFRALDDVEDEEILTKEEIKGLKKLREAKSFSTNNVIDMEHAEEYMNDPQGKVEDVQLQVIDADADTLEHLKNKEEYIGQYLLRCNSCRNTRFMDADKLESTVLEGEENERYNVEDECPFCHNIGTGYTLLGLVGKVPSGEESVNVSNDSLTDNADEVKFENDHVEDQVTLEAPKEEEVPAEQSEEEVDVEFDEIPELAYDETEFEDDTADLETPKLGDEHIEDFQYDDTEEIPETQQDDSLTQEDEEDEFFKVDLEDEKEVKEEELKEDVEEEATPVVLDEFIQTVVEPENMEHVTIYDIEQDSIDPIFDGKFEDIPESLKASEIVGFNSKDGRLHVNIDITNRSDDNLRKHLALFNDDFNEKIDLWDVTTGDCVFTGTKESCINEYADSEFVSFEHPEDIEINVRSVKVVEALKQNSVDEALDLTKPEDKLIYDILVANELSNYKVDRVGSPEYWLADCIRNKEDLDVIFKNYVDGKSEDLVNEFKSVTKYGSVENPVNVGIESEADLMKEAQDKLRNEKAFAVIYGYSNNGEFVALEEPLVLLSFRELQFARELLQRKHGFNGSVRAVYADSETESMNLRTDKDLTSFIKECKDNSWDYTVSKSLVEGFKYTVTREIVNENLNENAELLLAPEEGKVELVPTQVSEPEVKEEKTEEVTFTPEEVKEVTKEIVSEVVGPDETKTEEEQGKEIDAAVETKVDLAVEAKIEASEEHPEEDVEVEFDETAFESFINEWFDQNAEETKLFECTSGYINEENQIVLEGVIHLPDDNTEFAVFKLHENLNEDLNKVESYTVSGNQLTENLTYTL